MLFGPSCESVINVWNSLPAYAIDFTSLPKFRTLILKANLSSFIKRFQVQGLPVLVCKLFSCILFCLF